VAVRASIVRWLNSAVVPTAIATTTEVVRTSFTEIEIPALPFGDEPTTWKA
jgi:hypothetical protein